MESWNVNLKTGESFPKTMNGNYIDNTNTSMINYSGKWIHTLMEDKTVSRSDTKGSSLKVLFKGTQIGIYSYATPKSGYANIKLVNSKGDLILSSTVDMYCKYIVNSLTFISPKIKRDNYTLFISVIGNHGNWSNKRGDIFGSTGDNISLDRIFIAD